MSTTIILWFLSIPGLFEIVVILYHNTIERNIGLNLLSFYLNHLD